MYLKCFIQKKLSSFYGEASPVSFIRSLLPSGLSIPVERNPLILEFNLINHQWYIKHENQWRRLSPCQDIVFDSHIVTCETNLKNSAAQVTQGNNSSLRRNTLSTPLVDDPKEDKLAFLYQNVNPALLQTQSTYQNSESFSNTEIPYTSYSLLLTKEKQTEPSVPTPLVSRFKKLLKKVSQS